MRILLPVYTIILLLAGLGAKAQATITGVSKTILCPGNSFEVSYTVTPGSFTPGNVFTVQLSDATGNFPGSTPVIGSASSTSSGSIKCVIPTSITAGVLYRVRINSTLPATTSTNTSVDLNIQSYPLPKLKSDTTACQGGPFRLEVTNWISGATYTWINPAGSIIYSGIIYKLELTTTSLLISGKYVLNTSYFGCTHSDTTVYATIKPRPATPSVNAEDTICSGDTIHLKATSATSGVTWEWNGPNGFKSFSKDTSILNAPMAAQGYYKAVTTSVPDGCRSYPDSQLVVVKLSPPIHATNTSPVCEGLGLYITANDSTDSMQYSWTGPGGFNMTSNDTGFWNATLAMSGDYILKATLFDCTSIDTTTVLVKPQPLDPDASGNSPVCSGNELKLAAKGSSATAFQWTGPSGYSSDLQNPLLSNADTGMTGTYIVNANLNGCIKKDTIEIAVKPTPASPQIHDFATLVENDTLHLRIENPQPGAVYRWDGPGGFIDSIMDLTIPNIQPENTGLYSVTVSYDGCQAMSGINVQVWEIRDTGKIDLYPNPNNGNFTIKGYLPLNEEINISVHNASGQILYRNKVATIDNLFQDKISIPHASSGIYYLRIRRAGKKEVFPFVIKH